MQSTLSSETWDVNRTQLWRGPSFQGKDASAVPVEVGGRHSGPWPLPEHLGGVPIPEGPQDGKCVPSERMQSCPALVQYHFVEVNEIPLNRTAVLSG